MYLFVALKFKNKNKRGFFTAKNLIIFLTIKKNKKNNNNNKLHDHAERKKTF